MFNSLTSLSLSDLRVSLSEPALADLHTVVVVVVKSDRGLGLTDKHSDTHTQTHVI